MELLCSQWPAVVLPWQAGQPHPASQGAGQGAIGGWGCQCASSWWQANETQAKHSRPSIDWCSNLLLFQDWGCMIATITATCKPRTFFWQFEVLAAVHPNGGALINRDNRGSNTHFVRIFLKGKSLCSALKHHQPLRRKVYW